MGRILRLRNRELGIDLVPSSGDTLGRRFGQHVEVLSRFVQISSSHLELRCDAQGSWFAKDMNSFNHSYYNGCMLVAGEEQRLEQGATLALADIVLAVELE
ncbi:FHA domain-containing protein [Niveibacterium terrae]|uniref:FHA domain-containing protein n=1 Tax=Niveibacterium terrae TaxID=3373598 RepID=UPI003A8D1C80